MQTAYQISSAEPAGVKHRCHGHAGCENYSESQVPGFDSLPQTQIHFVPGFEGAISFRNMEQLYAMSSLGRNHRPHAMWPFDVFGGRWSYTGTLLKVNNKAWTQRTNGLQGLESKA